MFAGKELQTVGNILCVWDRVSCVLAVTKLWVWLPHLT